MLPYEGKNMFAKFPIHLSCLQKQMLNSGYSESSTCVSGVLILHSFLEKLLSLGMNWIKPYHELGVIGMTLQKVSSVIRVHDTASCLNAVWLADDRLGQSTLLFEAVQPATVAKASVLCRAAHCSWWSCYWMCGILTSPNLDSDHHDNGCLIPKYKRFLSVFSGVFILCLFIVDWERVQKLPLAAAGDKPRRISGNRLFLMGVRRNE